MFFDKSLFLKQKLKIQRLIVVLYMDQERHRFVAQKPAYVLGWADFLPLLYLEDQLGGRVLKC